jgi:hypothetical protein
VFFDAYLADWWQFEAFIQGTLSNEQRREILDDLFIDEKRLRNVPDGWRCPQWDLLLLDERERASMLLPAKQSSIVLSWDCR